MFGIRAILLAERRKVNVNGNGYMTSLNAANQGRTQCVITQKLIAAKTTNITVDQIKLVTLLPKRLRACLSIATRIWPMRPRAKRNQTKGTALPHPPLRI
jgi:hypothetical protein